MLHACSPLGKKFIASSTNFQLLRRFKESITCLRKIVFFFYTQIRLPDITKFPETHINSDTAFLKMQSLYIGQSHLNIREDSGKTIS